MPHVQTFVSGLEPMAIRSASVAESPRFCGRTTSSGTPRLVTSHTVSVLEYPPRPRHDLHYRSPANHRVNTRQMGDCPMPEWTLVGGVDADSQELRKIRGTTNHTTRGRSARPAGTSRGEWPNSRGN